MSFGVTLRRQLLALLLALPCTVSADPSQGTAQLVMAIMSNDMAAADKAIAAGADINADTGEGRTPLIVAAMSTRPALERLLLERGADPKRRAHDAIVGNATTAAFFAMNGTELTGRADDPDPKQHAQALEVLRLLAATKGELDLLVRRGPTELTALMIAAQAGAIDAVEILLDAGANPNATNGGKYTALDYAVDRAPLWAQASAADRAAVVKALVAAGAQADHKASDRLSPKERAQQSGNAEIMAALRSR